MTRLTPFDDELCVMVRSLTGNDPEIVETESYYTLKLDVSGKVEAEKRLLTTQFVGVLVIVWFGLIIPNLTREKSNTE